MCETHNKFNLQLNEIKLIRNIGFNHTQKPLATESHKLVWNINFNWFYADEI